MYSCQKPLALRLDELGIWWRSHSNWFRNKEMTFVVSNSTLYLVGCAGLCTKSAVISCNVVVHVWWLQIVDQLMESLAVTWWYCRWNEKDGCWHSYSRNWFPTCVGELEDNDLLWNTAKANCLLLSFADGIPTLSNNSYRQSNDKHDVVIMAWLWFQYPLHYIIFNKIIVLCCR